LSGRGLCDELITRPEESYRLCCVVVCDLEISRMGAPYIYIYMTLVAYGLKQSTSSWRSYSSYYNDVRNHEPEKSSSDSSPLRLLRIAGLTCHTTSHFSKHCSLLKHSLDNVPVVSF